MRRFDELSDIEKEEKIQRLAQKALLAYGLSGDLSLAANATSIVFQLRAGGLSLAVRISPPGSERVPLRRELTWLAALGRDTPLSVPEPILTLSGDLFRSVSMEGVPGTRACAVLRWVGGERREAELTQEETAAMGRFAAALHAHAETFRWPEELTPDTADAASRALAAADELRGALTSADDRALLCDAVARVADATSDLGDGAECVGVIHGELRLRKLRYEGGAVGAVGFDACRVGSYVEDLSLLWSEFSGREMATLLQDALIEGYRSVRRVSVSCEALRAFVTLRRLEEAARAHVQERAAHGSSHASGEGASEALRQGLALLRS